MNLYRIHPGQAGPTYLIAGKDEAAAKRALCQQLGMRRMPSGTRIALVQDAD